jgi:hypothetical protein
MGSTWLVVGWLLVWLLGPYAVWTASAGQSLPSKRFQAQVQLEGWKQMSSADELELRFSAKVEMYLKKDNGSLILIRSGRTEDFGISPFFTFASEDAELVYLMKLVTGGDYIEEVKLNSKNPLLSHAKAYSYKVQDKRLGPAKILAVMVKGKDTVLIEFLAKVKDFDQDRSAFHKFLDGLKEGGQ